ncbi:MAG: phospholipase D-like domain-containing protein [Desulfuromonadales bacterium]|nr:phospholipase D-like domain-containing protein [Desulfuromonadales bacterium]
MSLIRPPLQGPLNLTSRFFDRFRRSIDASFSLGNRVVLLRSGNEFFCDLFAAIEAATTSICLEFYIVRADRTGGLLATSLKRAVQRGVTVELLYDYIGSFDTPASFFASLEKDGIRCAAFNPPPFRNDLRWFDKRDHRKIAIIDCRLAFAGGLNIGDEYAGDDPLRSWRDMGLRLEGPAALELHQLFLENWRAASEHLPFFCSCSLASSDGDAAVAIVSGGPHHRLSRIRDAFLLGMASAGSSIRIETPYFVPGPRFLRAMLRAARRGVTVEIILPARSDVPLLRLVNRSYYAALLRGGIKVYERQGAILHAKVMLIDSSWAVIGSANLDQRSFHRNFEVSVIVASPEFGRQVEELFGAELSASQPIVLKEHERRSWLIRWLEWLLLPLNWFL